VPLQEYICDTCGNNFELVQGYHDDALVTCEECQNDTLRRVLFAPHIAVKQSDDNITLGHLGDRNRSRFSEDKKAHILKKNEPRVKPEDLPELPRGMTRVEKPEKKAPWWEESAACTATSKEIRKMDKKQADKYIKTGET
jgi:putative FmdB family regulatory protein